MSLQLPASVQEAKRAIEQTARLIEQQAATSRVPVTTFDWVVALAEPADKLVAAGWTGRMAARILCDVIATQRGEAPSLSTVIEYRRRLDEKFGMGLGERLRAWGYDVSKARTGTRFSDGFVQEVRERYKQVAQSVAGATEAEIPEGVGPQVREALLARSRKARSGLSALQRPSPPTTAPGTGEYRQSSGSVMTKPPARRPAGPTSPQRPPSMESGNGGDSAQPQELPLAGGASPQGIGERHADRSPAAQDAEVAARLRRLQQRT